MPAKSRGLKRLSPPADTGLTMSATPSSPRAPPASSPSRGWATKPSPIAPPAGNADAFAALYERYHGPLLGYCRSILLNAEDAHDATQSALENALRALPRREPGRPLKPWLYRIAHNEAINIVRRRQPRSPPASRPMTCSRCPDRSSTPSSATAWPSSSTTCAPARAPARRARHARAQRPELRRDRRWPSNVTPEGARRAVFDARTALHDAHDGRETECTSVRRCLSDGDRRRLRARGMRAHLRACNDCATFERAMGIRQTDLHVLGPWLGGAGLLGALGCGDGHRQARAPWPRRAAARSPSVAAV